MKKIAVLLLLVLSLAGCEMYKTKDVLIDNKSNHSAALTIRNVKEDDKKVLETVIKVNAQQAITLPFYNDGEVSLQSIGKNYLKKISNTHYDVLDLPAIMFTVYNTTDKKVKLSEMYNLFDIQTIDPNQTKDNVKIFNPEKIKPKATTVSDGIILQVKVQANKIIITY